MDGAAWPEVVTRICERPDLVMLAHETDHRGCRHAQPQAALPLIWRIALMLYVRAGRPARRRIHMASFADVTHQIGGLPADLVVTLGNHPEADLMRRRHPLRRDDVSRVPLI